MLKRGILFLGGLSLALSAFALDKTALETNIRKALNLDMRMPISAGDVKPSPIEGLNEVQVTIQGNPYPVYITKDEKKYIWGQMFDLTVDPDTERMRQIDLKNVHYRGSANAPVTIVEYSDLQCPHCRDAHQIMKTQLFKSFTKDQVRWVLKEFPLTGHDWAEPAAIAAECAGRQKEDAFWAFADDFFTNAPKISSTTVHAQSLQFARDQKLDIGKFKSCLEDPSVLERVKANKVEGLKVGVQSTPTFVVNGRMRRGIRDMEDLKPLIEEKLEAAHKK